MIQDFRLALRLLRSNPGFTAVAVLTLALGIGANSAIFSIVNTVVFRPLPFEDENRVVRLYDVRRSSGGDSARVGVSQRNFFHIRENARSFESVAASLYQPLALMTSQATVRVIGMGVSDGWLTTLGVRPVLGRSFTAEEERLGADSRVALVSHDFWSQRFGGEPAAVGREILLDDEAHTVVGVMPPGFRFPYHAQLWRPWTFDRSDGEIHHLNVQARLKPGVTLDEAQSELATIASRLQSEFPNTNEGYTLVARPTREWFVADTERSVWLLLAGVGFVLLIACANIANLLMARSVAREKEFALRAALGASRGRQIRQLLTETLTLALAGGVGAGLFALWVSPLLTIFIPSDLATVVPRVQLDSTVFAFTFAVSLATGIVIGTLPAFATSRRNLLQAMPREPNVARQRWLSALVVSEIALALTLLSGAALMVESLLRLQQRDLGYETETIISFRALLPEERYTSPDPRIQFVRQALERIESLPGVARSGVVDVFPLATGNEVAPIQIEGQPHDPDRPSIVTSRVASPGYFEAMQIPVAQGRAFTMRDDADSVPVVIVSRSLAERFWPDRNPIGERLRFANRVDAPWRTVIGVVGDVARLHEEYDALPETLYRPYSQNLVASNAWNVLQLFFVIRSAADPAGVLPAVQQAVQQVDPSVPIYDVATGGDSLRARLSPRYVAVALLGCFGAFGLLMAALGIYGVLSFVVGRRVREIGVRLTFGARRADVLRMILGQGARWIVLGIALGTVGAILGARVVRSVLSEAAPASPGVLAVIVVTLMAIALLASYRPARRASNVDPAQALRAE